MKRTKIDIQDIASFNNLAHAAVKAAQGKRQRPEVVCFFANFEDNLQELRNTILDGHVPCGNFKQFTIYDPKKRVIHAPCFKDRVLHHAVMNFVGPVLERAMVDSSYACRQGKGVHAAVKKAYPSGALPSQHFANYFLDSLDRYIMEILKARAQIRYMDDIIWWCDDCQQAKSTLAKVVEYVENNLRLKVKEKNIQINKSQRGVTYCGFACFAGKNKIIHPQAKTIYYNER